MSKSNNQTENNSINSSIANNPQPLPLLTQRMHISFMTQSNRKNTEINGRIFPYSFERIYLRSIAVKSDIIIYFIWENKFTVYDSKLIYGLMDFFLILFFKNKNM